MQDIIQLIDAVLFQDDIHATCHFVPVSVTKSALLGGFQ